MFEEQIKALAERELRILQEIEGIEQKKSQLKGQLVVIRKAKKQMEGLEEQLGGQVNISE